MHNSEHTGNVPNCNSHASYCFPDFTNEGTIIGGSGSKNKHNSQILDSGNKFKRLVDGSSESEKEASLLDELIKQKAQIETEAFAKGYSEGQQAGMAAESKKMLPVLNNFSDSLKELEHIKRQMYQNAEKETVRLALAIAKKIINEEIRINHDIIFNVVKKALKNVEEHERIIIKVNSADHELLEMEKPNLLKHFDNTAGILFETDNSILNGGCMIETNLGSIDARIDQQIKALEEVFSAELQKSSFEE